MRPVCCRHTWSTIAIVVIVLSSYYSRSRPSRLALRDLRLSHLCILISKHYQLYYPTNHLHHEYYAQFHYIYITRHDEPPTHLPPTFKNDPPSTHHLSSFFSPSTLFHLFFSMFFLLHNHVRIYIVIHPQPLSQYLQVTTRPQMRILLL